MNNKSNYQKKVSAFLYTITLIVLICSTGALLGHNDELKTEIKSVKSANIDLEHDLDSVKSVNDSLSKRVIDVETAKNFINWKGYSYPKLLLAVIKEESGNMKSPLRYKNNNIIGMKFPSKRETTAVYEKNGYSYYMTLEDSIEDLNIYFELYIAPKGLSRKQAAYYLEKNYSMSKGYAERLLKLI